VLKANPIRPNLPTLFSKAGHTMKAIVHDTYGSPDGLKLREIDKPSPIVDGAVPGPSFAAALYLLTMSPVVDAPGTFATAYAMPADAGPADATWNGSEVHADVHRIIWDGPRRVEPGCGRGATAGCPAPTAAAYGARLPPAHSACPSPGPGPGQP
jgi:hypothetical protein